MITLKKTIKSGTCAAMRCTQMTGDKLCARHAAEHVAEGSPELKTAETPAPKATGGALATLPDERQAALTTERHTLQQILAAAQTFPLDTDEAIAQAQAHQNAAHQLAKDLDSEMHSATDPLEAVKKKIRSWFKPNIDTALAIKETFARRIGAELADRKARRDAALREIQANAGAAAPEAFHAAHAIVTAPEESGGLIEQRGFEVVDFASLPDEFKVTVVNTPALAAAVKAGRSDIPGVKVTVTNVSRVGRAA